MNVNRISRIAIVFMFVALLVAITMATIIVRPPRGLRDADWPATCFVFALVLGFVTAVVLAFSSTKGIRKLGCVGVVGGIALLNLTLAYYVTWAVRTAEAETVRANMGTIAAAMEDHRRKDPKHRYATTIADLKTELGNADFATAVGPGERTYRLLRPGTRCNDGGNLVTVSPGGIGIATNIPSDGCLIPDTTGQRVDLAR